MVQAVAVANWRVQYCIGEGTRSSLEKSTEVNFHVGLPDLQLVHKQMQQRSTVWPCTCRLPVMAFQYKQQNLDVIENESLRQNRIFIGIFTRCQVFNDTDIHSGLFDRLLSMACYPTVIEMRFWSQIQELTVSVSETDNRRIRDKITFLLVDSSPISCDATVVLTDACCSHMARMFRGQVDESKIVHIRHINI